MKQFMSILLFLCYLPVAYSATEYLRIEGTLTNSIDPSLWSYDELYGWQPGDGLYFDFRVDLQANVPGSPDVFPRDYFVAHSLEFTGNTGPGAEHLAEGVTTSYPEGKGSWLDFGEGLSIGITPDYYDIPPDFSIATWNVGKKDLVLLGSYNEFAFDQWNPFADMTVTYRSSAPPPAYVPLPAAVWLLLTGLLMLLPRLRRN